MFSWCTGTARSWIIATISIVPAVSTTAVYRTNNASIGLIRTGWIGLRLNRIRPGYYRCSDDQQQDDCLFFVFSTFNFSASPNLLIGEIAFPAIGRKGYIIEPLVGEGQGR